LIRSKPNFLIVGAAKSGTSSLYSFVKQHPDVFMPDIKEPSFFSATPADDSFAVVSEKDYMDLFLKVKNEKAIGESSNAYLHDVRAPEKIKTALGEIKIIIILRNPVDMAFSLYNYLFLKHWEPIKSFEEALKVEENRRRDPIFKKNCFGFPNIYFYFQRGLYFEHVKRYIDTFGRKNVMVLIFEDFIKEPIQHVQSIYEFLKINKNFVPELKVHNAAEEIQYIPPIFKGFPTIKRFLKFIFKLINYNRPLPSIKTSTKKHLIERYQSDIAQLEGLIEKDLSIWNAKV
jgi:Sulfotransferase domain